MGYVLPAVKEKANAKGNGDWHLRNNSFPFVSECKKVVREFCKIPIRGAASWYL